MTLEQKAKAYDEALKQAKFYHGNCPSEPERKKLEKMFPVLCESEDEKLRKLVIYRVRTATEMTEGLRELLLDYLEKQKEQKPIGSDDDYHWVGLIQHLRDYQKTIDRSSNNLAYESIEDYIEWIKSLHPSWKSSEQDELMKLKYAGTSTKLD